MSDKGWTLADASQYAYQKGRIDERRNWTADGSTHYDGCEHYHPRCEARMLRDVLTDLIAELRAYQEDRDTTERLLASQGECLCDGKYPDVDRCTLHNTRQVASMADRAAARLREVTGDE